MTYLNACLSALQLLLGAVLLPLGLLLQARRLPCSRRPCLGSYSSCCGQGRLDAGRATGATSELFRGFVACFIAGRDSLDGDMCKARTTGVPCASWQSPPDPCWGTAQWSFALLLVYLLAHAAAAYYTLALLGKSRCVLASGCA